MRDIALPLIPKYNEFLRPLADGLIEVRQTMADVLPDGKSACLAASKISRSFTKANPSFTLKITSGWAIGTDHRLQYGEYKWEWMLLSLGKELGGWVKMGVAREMYGGYSFEPEFWLWMRPWPEEQKIVIIRQSGIVCPECGEWQVDSGNVRLMREFEGRGTVEAFVCDECHLWKPMDEMDEYKKLETIPEEIMENELVTVLDSEAELEKV